MLTKLLCFLGAVIALLPSASHAHLRAPSATLEAGVIVGTTSTAAGSTVTVNQFLGVPFAAKPVRFGMPEPPYKWKKPLKTTKKAPSCLQQFNYPAAVRDVVIKLFDTLPPPAGESEDCLYLDVYVPATATKNKTVIFFLFGGSLQYGSNSLAVYDGTNVAANQDIILVAPKSRTNVFGFSNSPQIPFDQRNVGFNATFTSLEAILRLSPSLDGPHEEPGKRERLYLFLPKALCVTNRRPLSVDNLITTQPTNLPFRAAILQSGQSPVYDQVAKGTVAWDALAAQLNCSTQADVLKCVRAANSSTIVSIIEHSNLNFSPVKDNITELQNPEAARKAGNVTHVPILTGTTAQEGTVIEYGQKNTTAFLMGVLGNHTALIKAVELEYSLGSTANGWPITDAYRQISAIYTDAVYQCPLSIVANDSYSVGIATWRYLYNATFPNIMPLPELGVFHRSEIPLIFGNLQPNATALEKKLSTYMQSVWANFAKNPHAGPPWPPYPSVAVLGTTKQTVTTVPAAELDIRCPFLDPYLEYVPNGAS